MGMPNIHNRLQTAAHNELYERKWSDAHDAEVKNNLRPLMIEMEITHERRRSFPQAAATRTGYAQAMVQSGALLACARPFEWIGGGPHKLIEWH